MDRGTGGDKGTEGRRRKVMGPSPVTDLHDVPTEGKFQNHHRRFYRVTGGVGGRGRSGNGGLRPLVTGSDWGLSLRSTVVSGRRVRRVLVHTGDRSVVFTMRLSMVLSQWTKNGS